MAVEFEWDPDKAAANLEKHGVDFVEASTIFGDPLEVTIPDPNHSEGETRFLSLGRSAESRILVRHRRERLGAQLAEYARLRGVGNVDRLQTGGVPGDQREVLRRGRVVRCVRDAIERLLCAHRRIVLGDTERGE